MELSQIDRLRFHPVSPKTYAGCDAVVSISVSVSVSVWAPMTMIMCDNNKSEHDDDVDADDGDVKKRDTRANI